MLAGLLLIILTINRPSLYLECRLCLVLDGNISKVVFFIYLSNYHSTQYICINVYSWLRALAPSPCPLRPGLHTNIVLQKFQTCLSHCKCLFCSSLNLLLSIHDISDSFWPNILLILKMLSSYMRKLTCIHYYLWGQALFCLIFIYFFLWPHFFWALLIFSIFGKHYFQVQPLFIFLCHKFYLFVLLQTIIYSSLWPYHSLKTWYD